MPINVTIDDKLLRQAMQGRDGGTERAVVEAALQLLIDTQAQTGIGKLRGKVQWEGNLDESRT
jgi:Arc/MetJ family transcription regulator